MVGVTTEKPIPKHLEDRLKKGWFYRTAERYYRHHHSTTHLYFEITGEGNILVYDGWDYKRGYNKTPDGIEPAVFEQSYVKPEDLKTKISALLCFTRLARRYYEWNIKPVLDFNEIVLRSR